MRRSNRLTVRLIKIFLAVLAAGFLLTVVAPAQAVHAVEITASGGNWTDGDDGKGKWTDGDAKKKKEAEAAGQKAISDKMCGGIKDKIKLPVVKDVADGKCREIVKSSFTLQKVMDSDAEQVCKDIGANVEKDVPAVSADVFSAACTTALEAAQITFDWVQKTYKAAYDKVMEAAKKVVKAVKFIKDPKYGYQFLLNDVKSGVDKLVKDAFKNLNETSSFQGDEEWWRNSYAVTAGLGILAIAILWMKTWSDSANGLLEPGELGNSLYPWGVVAFSIFFFGPPFMYMFAKFSNALVDGVFTWMGTDVTEVGTTIMGLILGMSVGVVPGGLLVGGLLLLLVAIGIISMLLFFGLQYVATYVFGAMLGTAAAGLGHPNFRRKALVAIAFFIALLLARPAYLIVLGVFSKMVNGWLSGMDVPISGMWPDDPLGTLGKTFTIAIALIIMSVSPVAVLKFFPLIPDSSTTGGGAVMTGGTAGSAAGGAAQGAGNIMMQRRMAAGQRSGGASVSSGASGEGGGGGSQTAASIKPSGVGQSGKSSAASTGKVGAGANTASKAAGGSASAGGGAGAASSAGAAGSAGTGAAAAGSGAAAAGSGAATAGVGAAAVMAADMGVKIGQSSHRKAKDASEGAAPQLENQGSA